jgi:hypothetical protein
MLPTSKYLRPRTDGKMGAYAYCDRTGFRVMHSDLRKQMTYAGNELIWTGYMVHKDFIDEPNPQSKPFVPRRDPKSVENARPNQIDYTKLYEEDKKKRNLPEPT